MEETTTTEETTTEEETPIDYIVTDRQYMLDYHGKYMFLFGPTGLNLFETETIKDYTEHPITGEPLSEIELRCIKFHANAYTFSKNMELNLETLQEFFKWYDDSRKKGNSVQKLRDDPDTNEAYKIVRYYLTPIDFQSHFRNFNPADSDQELFERDLAEKALRKGVREGLWLLRHSSQNRPTTKEAADELQIKGIRYYAISFIDKKAQKAQILHRLIMQRIGFGWQFLNIWFTNFLACLEYALKDLDLSYHRRISAYMMTED